VLGLDKGSKTETRENLSTYNYQHVAVARDQGPVAREVNRHAFLPYFYLPLLLLAIKAKFKSEHILYDQKTYFT